MPDFVHLHVHSEYSFFRSTIRIPELVEIACSMGMEAVALTDHNNIHGALEFSAVASRIGASGRKTVKPIIGAEVSVAVGSRFQDDFAGDHHLVLLCEDAGGYGNLARLLTLAHLEGVAGRPRVDRELIERHHDGLIGLSGGLLGEIPSLLLAGDLVGARKAAQWHTEVFGNGCFFMELQSAGGGRGEQANGGLLGLARDLDIPVVATVNCHYLNREDRRAYHLLRCLGSARPFSDSPELWDPLGERLFQTSEGMAAAFVGLEEALWNTVAIAERCNVDLMSVLAPSPAGKDLATSDPDGALRSRARNGLGRRLASTPGKTSTYRSRLEREIAEIAGRGWTADFLLLSDFVHACRTQEIPIGTGTGLLPASLVAYALGLTEVDPVALDLDCDLLFAQEGDGPPYLPILLGRENVESALRELDAMLGGPGGPERYRVAGAVRFETLRGKALELAVRTVLHRSDSRGGGATGDWLGSRGGGEETAPFPAQWASAVRRLEGIKTRATPYLRGALEDIPAVTASAFVVRSQPLLPAVPLARGASGEVLTQVPLTGLARAGFERAVAVHSLGEIEFLSAAEDWLTSSTELGRGWNAVPFDDDLTFRILRSGATDGVYLLGDPEVQALLRAFAPSDFEDLAGFIAAGMAAGSGAGVRGRAAFIGIRDLIKSKGVVRHPESVGLEPIPLLQQTYGLLLYREQATRALAEAARMSLAETMALLRLLAKGVQSGREGLRRVYLESAEAHDADLERADQVFELVAGRLGNFPPRSHVVPHTLISYRMAYIKGHYPLRFGSGGIERSYMS